MLPIIAPIAAAARLLLGCGLLGVGSLRLAAPHIARRAIARAGIHRAVRSPAHALPIALLELALGGALLLPTTMVAASIGVATGALLALLLMLADRRPNRSVERGYFGRFRLGPVTSVDIVRHLVLALAAMVVLTLRPTTTPSGVALAVVGGILILRSAAGRGASVIALPHPTMSRDRPTFPPRGEGAEPPFTWPDPPL